MNRTKIISNKQKNNMTIFRQKINLKLALILKWFSFSKCNRIYVTKFNKI